MWRIVSVFCFAFTLIIDAHAHRLDSSVGRKLEGQPKDIDAKSGCEASMLAGYNCTEALGGDFLIHWKREKDGVSFVCATTGTGWVGIGWPKTPGQMIGADTVMGFHRDVEPVSTYRLESKAPSGIIKDTSLFELKKAHIEAKQDGSVMKFKRLFDDEFKGKGKTDFVVAFHATSNGVDYHGPKNRGAVTIVFPES